MSELSAEAEAIAQGVEAREAAADAIEADPDMVGSEAWQERQWEEMADRGDDYADDDAGRIFSRYEEHVPDADYEEEPF